MHGSDTGSKSLAMESTIADDLINYCEQATKGGASHAKPIHPASVVTAPWVRLKCQFGCPGYGKSHCCPPHSPTPEQTQAILDSYSRAILFHIEVPDMPEKEKHYRKYFDMLVDLEGEIFKDGYYKAFVFLAGPCRLCKKCTKLQEPDAPCKLMGRARPCMEACGMDVFQTARNNGYFIDTLREKNETNNEYCLMLID
jgi:predicted metal-binding protein